MNKKDLAALLSQGGLTAAQIEDLLTDFLNNEKAKVRPKIDLLGAGIIEPETIEPVNIKPEDMVSGEWYVLTTRYKYLIKFDLINAIGDVEIKLLYDFDSIDWGSYKLLCSVKQIKSIRKATREEVIKYFPQEFDIDRVTDEQL
jgi:hypothetical protein